MGSRSVVRRLLSRLRRNRLDDDLAEEIRQHLDLRRRSLIDAGMDPREAAYEARRQFGNVLYIRERARDSWSFPSLSSLASDIRFALRMMSRAPGHTAAVVLTIALGAGLNGAVFVIFNAVLLGTPRVPEPHGVVRLDDGRPTLGPTYPDYVDYRDRTANAVNLAAHSSTNVSVRPDLLSAGAPERATATLASGNYFAVMGARAIHGRTFDGRDDLPPTGRPVVVLGETYWTRRFNRDPTVVGRTIELNSQPFTIVGVLPADFRDVDVPGMSSPFVRELWVPLWTLPVLEPGDTRLVERTAWWGLQSIGRSSEECRSSRHVRRFWRSRRASIASTPASGASARRGCHA